MSKVHTISEVRFKDDSMMLVIDGKTHNFDLKDISQLLFKATSQQREQFEISPSGYGIHWPLIDEDLSIDGLLGIEHSLPQKCQVG